MKTIEQLSARAVKARLKAIYALDQATLTREQLAEREKLEARQYALYREKHPPIATPPGFVSDIGDDW